MQAGESSRLINRTTRLAVRGTCVDTNARRESVAKDGVQTTERPGDLRQQLSDPHDILATQASYQAADFKHADRCDHSMSGDTTVGDHLIQ